MKLAATPMRVSTAMPTANQVESGLMYRPSLPVTARPRVTTDRQAASPRPSQRVASEPRVRWVS